MKKLISLFLSIVMLFGTMSCLSTVAFAMEDYGSYEDDSWTDDSIYDDSWNDDSWTDDSIYDDSWNDDSWNDDSWEDDDYWDDDDWDDDDYFDGKYIEENGFEAYTVSETECEVEYFPSAKEVTIPSEIDGYKVVSVSPYVWNYTVEILNLPATINEISLYNFSGLGYLKEINVDEANTTYKSQNGVVYTYDLNEIVAVPNAFCGDIVIPLGTTELSDDILQALKNANSVTFAEGHEYFAEEDGIIYNSDFTKIYFAKTLPEKYVMKSTVKEIGRGAFAGINTVKSAKISSKVTNISYAAFDGCSALKTLTLPEGIVSIDEAAFASNKALTEVSFPKTMKTIGTSAFEDCKALNKISLNKVEFIDSSAFARTAIKSVTIPKTVTLMGGNVFAGCKSLSKVVLGTGLYEVAWGTFSGCKALKSIEFPKNIKVISNSAFSATGFTSITIPSTIKSVYSWAFGNCDSLKTVTIGKGVDYINGAFGSCDVLEKVTFNKGFNGTCDYAFTDCPKLKTISLPSTVTELSYHEFDGCSSLKKIDIPSKLLKIDAHALDDTGWYKAQDTGEMYLEHVLYGYKNTKKYDEMPKDYKLSVKSGTKSIAYSAFQDQAGLEKVTLPDTVQFIGAGAFYNCKNLKSIVIPVSVTHIGHQALGYKKWQEPIEGFTIYGVKGTEAEEYAEENGFKFKSCKHSKTKWETVKKATVNAAGKKKKKCTACGKVLDTAKIKQLTCSKPKLKSVSNTEYGVKITWGKVTGADKYAVYRKVKGGAYSKIGTTNKTSYTDKKAKSGKTYYYIVKAINEAGISDSSSAKLIKCLADPTLKSATSTKKGVVLKWSKVTGADGYMVYRKTGSGSYSKIATVKGSSKASYTDKKAKKGKKYTYKIKAYDGKTYSVYSNTKTVKDKY